MADALLDRRPCQRNPGPRIEALDLENRRAPIRSKGGETEWVYWDTGTAHLLPRLLLPDGSSRTSGPLFQSSRRPVPTRRPGPGDICPHTGRARLGYDRARILLQTSTGWNLHQLRHSAATHLGDNGVPLQLIMAKTRHKSPHTAIRYVNPGPAAVAKVTSSSARPAGPTELSNRCRKGHRLPGDPPSGLSVTFRVLRV
jgi:integrase